MPREPRKKGGQAAARLGRSRGGFTTKLNLSLSETWVPLRLILTPGNRNDITQASALLEGYCYASVIGDKAYDSDAFREAIVSGGGVAVIPPRESRTDPPPYDEALYKRRNIIERFFHRLKQYRRIATHYDKLGIRYLGFVYFATIL
ncbi:IS5 family transposase, partial [Candidatus Poribacteria bacterium]|nr:IS5 family transposase [Candidatus Poribacteria bacterium]